MTAVLASEGGRGGAAALALLGLHQGQATVASACAADMRPRAKLGEGQRCSRCLAHFAGGPGQGWGGGGGAVAFVSLTLLSLHSSALVGCWG